MTSGIEIGDGRSARRDYRISGLVGGAHAFSHFYQLVLPPMFPLIHAQEGYSYTQLGLLVALFFTTSGVCQAPAGFLIDRLGARPVLITGLGLLAGATMLYGVFPMYWALAVLSLIAGLGCSVFHPADLSILSASVGDARIGRAFGIHSFTGFIGYAVAPSVMWFLGESSGWQQTAMLMGVAGIVYLIALAALSGDFRDSTDERGSTETPQPGGVRLLMQWPIVMFFLFFATLAMAQIGVMTNMHTALISLFDTPPALATGAITAFLVGTPIGVLAGGIIADRWHRHDLIAEIFLIATAVTTVAGGLLAMPEPVRLTLFAISGISFGLVLPSRDLLVRSCAPAHASGRVYGFVYSGLDLGSAFMPVVFGWMVDKGFAAWVFISIGICYALCLMTLFGSARSLGGGRPRQ